jgi:hypothetical protein
MAFCLKAGTEYGFGIETFDQATPSTVAHDLDAVPEMMITKTLDSIGSWAVYHFSSPNKTSPEDYFAKLEEPGFAIDTDIAWNDTAPTSTVFTIGSAFHNESCIAYLFASIDGYSKVFTYEGNGNVNGPYIYCGFRPRYILIKNIDWADSWVVLDTERDVYNPVSNYLLANWVNVEASVTLLDVNSNGFKLISSANSVNKNDNTLIGIAFAEQPFKYSNAR